MRGSSHRHSGNHPVGRGAGPNGQNFFPRSSSRDVSNQRRRFHKKERAASRRTQKVIERQLGKSSLSVPEYNALLKLMQAHPSWNFSSTQRKKALFMSFSFLAMLATISYECLLTIEDTNLSDSEMIAAYEEGRVHGSMGCEHYQDDRHKRITWYVTCLSVLGLLGSLSLAAWRLYPDICSDIDRNGRRRLPLFSGLLLFGEALLPLAFKLLPNPSADDARCWGALDQPYPTPLPAGLNSLLPLVSFLPEDRSNRLMIFYPFMFLRIFWALYGLAQNGLEREKLEELSRAESHVRVEEVTDDEESAQDNETGAQGSETGAREMPTVPTPEKEIERYSMESGYCTSWETYQKIMLKFLEDNSLSLEAFKLFIDQTQNRRMNRVLAEHFFTHVACLFVSPFQEHEEHDSEEGEDEVCILEEEPYRRAAGAAAYLIGKLSTQDLVSVVSKIMEKNKTQVCVPGIELMWILIGARLTRSDETAEVLTQWFNFLKNKLFKTPYSAVKEVVQSTLGVVFFCRPHPFGVAKLESTKEAERLVNQLILGDLVNRQHLPWYDEIDRNRLAQVARQIHLLPEETERSALLPRGPGSVPV